MLTLTTFSRTNNNSSKINILIKKKDQFFYHSIYIPVKPVNRQGQFVAAVLTPTLYLQLLRNLSAHLIKEIVGEKSTKEKIY